MVAESEAVNQFFGGLANIGSDIVAALNGDAETITQAFRALGGMVGNAFAKYFLMGFQEVLSKVDTMLLPRWLEPHVETVFGTGARLFDGTIQQADAAMNAWRESLAAAGRAGSASAESRGARGVGVVGGSTPGTDMGGGGGSSFRGRPFAGTLEELRALRDAIQKADQALVDARLAEALARPGEEAQKSAEKVADLAAQLAYLDALAARYGGRSGLTAATGTLAPPSLPRMGPGRVGVDMGPVDRVARDLQGRQAQRVLSGLENDELAGAEARFRQTAGIVAGTMSDITATMVRGTDQIEASIVGMVGNILERSIKDPLAGGILGGIFAIGSAFLSRRSDRPRVIVDDYGSAAERKMREADKRPVRITNVIESGGRPIGEIEREMMDRQDRDEVVRFPRGSGLGR